MLILTKKGDSNTQKHWGPPLASEGGVFSFFFRFLNFFTFSQTLDISSKQLGEMFEGNSADTCDVKFPLAQMGG